MNKSASIKNIATALVLFHVKVGSVKKESTNPFFKSKYASLSNILEVIANPLEESGLTFSQFPTGDCGMTTILMHAESGEFLESEYTMQPTKNDPQGKGSVITYQRRYALASVLGLNIEDDDDGNAASAPPRQAEKSDTKELPWLNESMPEFASAVEKMKAGKSTVVALRKFFKISKEMETKLTNASKN